MVVNRWIVFIELEATCELIISNRFHMWKPAALI